MTGGKLILVLVTLGLAAGERQAAWGDEADIAALREADSSAKLAAIGRLAADPAGSAAALEPLTDLYLTDPQVEVRRAARQAVTKIRKATRRPLNLASRSSSPAKSSGVARPDKADVVAEPKAPTGRLAELIAQVRSDDPAACQKALAELMEMGDAARPASEAIVVAIIRTDPRWNETRLVATEALEKIHPELQKPVWAMVVEQMTDMGRMSGHLEAIANLGQEGRGALPLLVAYWERPPEEGFRVTAYLLQTMHAVAPRHKGVTELIQAVIRQRVPAGEESIWYAVSIADQRGLAHGTLMGMLLPYLEVDYVNFVRMLPKLTELMEAGEISAAELVPPLIKALESGDDRTIVAAEKLGQLGSDAKAAVAALKKVKFQDMRANCREAAENALKLIEVK